MHIEFRVRTLCELVLNEKDYLHLSIISHLCPDGIAVSKNALVATLANFGRAVSNIATEVAQTVLRYDCIDTTKLGQYSNMWHVHGLASALGRPILSLYPAAETNDRIRPLLHKLINPRIQTGAQDQVPLIILWTKTQPMVRGSILWSPNHFVPCYDPTKLSDANKIHKDHSQALCCTKYLPKSPHLHSLVSISANATDCPSNTCMVVSSSASESATVSCTSINNSDSSSSCCTQKAGTDSISANNSPLCQLITVDHMMTPKSQCHGQVSNADTNPTDYLPIMISTPASGSTTLSCTTINDSNTSPESLYSPKADTNSISIC